ncbi:hypothetical protein F5Y16DRAFT_13399 [Xylariaceae sp. FL0255]|nr:hypothetical protein F5Y16DRAFT_13399 [Xylariaceae sp. FL0255]
MPAPPSSAATVERSQKGLLRDGKWYCNCSPRHLAVIQTTTRHTKNHGRTFYCCPTNPKEGNQCTFFLWSEEAREREGAALFSNNRSEGPKPKKQMTLHESITPRTDKRKYWETTPITKLSELQSSIAGPSNSTAAPIASTSAPPSTNKSSATLKDSDTPAVVKIEGDFYVISSDEESIDSPSKQRSAMKGKGPAVPATPKAASKRKRSDVDYDDLLDELSSGAEEELVAVTEKSARHRDALITPAATRITDVGNGMPTPSLTKANGKSIRRVLFADLEAAGSRSAPGDKRQGVDVDSSATPSRAPFEAQSSTTDATAGPSHTSSGPQATTSASKGQTQTNDSDGLTQEVLALLKDENISANTLSAVRKVLDKYSAQMKGLEQGRKSVRHALEQSQAHNAQLQARINDHEEARKVSRTALMGLYQSF